MEEFLISAGQFIHSENGVSESGGDGISGGAPWKCWFSWDRGGIGDAGLEGVV